MSSFLTIPLSEILIFLEENRLKKPQTTEGIYLLAWEAINSKIDLVISSLFIKDFIIAYNSQELINQEYRVSIILSSSDEELRALSNLFGLPIIRRDRILRILSYLGLLVNNVSIFDPLPREVVKVVISYLDTRSITTFRGISKKFSELFSESEITEILRIKLHQTTRLDLTTYNKIELGWLDLSERNKDRLASGLNGFNLIIYGPDQVCSWGRNGYGQLGHGKFSKGITRKPRTIPGLKNIKAVAAGTNHSLALDFQGRVHSFGYNEMGQLGLGHLNNINLPTLIPNLTKITAIFTRHNSSFALNDQGETYEFGISLHELDHGLPYILSSPRLLDLKEIVMVAPELLSCLYLTKGGLVFGSGSNNHQQLGFVDEGYHEITQIEHLTDIVSLSLTSSYSLFLNSQGEVFVLGQIGFLTKVDAENRSIFPRQIPGLNRAIFIIATHFDIMILDNQRQGWILDNDKLISYLHQSEVPEWFQSDVIALETTSKEGLTITRTGELRYYTGLHFNKIDQLELY